MAGDWNTTAPLGYYICGGCGQTVQYNGTHYCPPQTYTTPQVCSSVFDFETRELLRRIAYALEKIAGITKDEETP
jgi:hypothetical protein